MVVNIDRGERIDEREGEGILGEKSQVFKVLVYTLTNYFEKKTK